MVLLNIGTRRPKVGEIVTYDGHSHVVVGVERQTIHLMQLAEDLLIRYVDYRDVPESMIGQSAYQAISN